MPRSFVVPQHWHKSGDTWTRDAVCAGGGRNTGVSAIPTHNTRANADRKRYVVHTMFHVGLLVIPSSKHRCFPTFAAGTFQRTADPIYLRWHHSANKTTPESQKHRRFHTQHAGTSHERNKVEKSATFYVPPPSLADTHNLHRDSHIHLLLLIG
jgi:hypothetical protein